MLKSKTVWAAAAAIVTAAGGYFTGELSSGEAFMAVVVAATALFQRHATYKLADQFGGRVR
jgi:hypothetical protein